MVLTINKKGKEMELSKEQANQLIKQAIELLENAHHGYYKNCGSNEEAEKDDAICEALDILGN